jgi:hypothetical protein
MAPCPWPSPGRTCAAAALPRTGRSGASRPPAAAAVRLRPPRAQIAGLAAHLERPLELRAVDRDSSSISPSMPPAARFTSSPSAKRLQLGDRSATCAPMRTSTSSTTPRPPCRCARSSLWRTGGARRGHAGALADDPDDSVRASERATRPVAARDRLTFQLFAPVRRAAVVVARQALEREDGPLARRPEATGIARGLERAVLGVEVPVLVADRLGRSRRGEPRELVGRQQALTGRHVGHPVFELDFHRPPVQQCGHARGSIDPAAPTPEWWE